MPCPGALNRQYFVTRPFGPHALVFDGQLDFHSYLCEADYQFQLLTNLSCLMGMKVKDSRAVGAYICFFCFAVNILGSHCHIHSREVPCLWISIKSSTQLKKKKKKSSTVLGSWDSCHPAHVHWPISYYCHNYVIHSNINISCMNKGQNLSIIVVLQVSHLRLSHMTT